MKRRVGVFGGSFDPPHLGHLLAAVYALKVFELEEVWLVPAYRHAFGKPLSPYSKRLDMCRRLIRGLGPRFRVSTIEKQIRSEGKMLNTLLALRSRHKDCEFSLVVGSDILKERRKWYRFAEIERRFGVLAVPRQGHSRQAVTIPDISSTEIRRRLKLGQPLDDLVTPDVNVRSTRRPAPRHRDKRRRPGPE